MTAAKVWLGPVEPAPVREAIEAAGGAVVPAEKANVVVWSSGSRPPAAIAEVLHEGIEWVQLDVAGVETWIEAGLVDRERRWTGAQGVYAESVAEHAVAFVLAGARGLPQAARRQAWGEVRVDRLRGATVGIVGAGGIGRETIARLAPFRVRILAQTRSGRDVPGADRSLGPGDLDELLRESDYVVLAPPLTAETRGMIGERELDLIGPDGWLVNVGRGGLVDTDALVRALGEGRLRGACLDVTDPEPLPEGHPLWRLENALVTPHVANPWLAHYDVLADRVAENVRRFVAGEELVGEIDLDRSY